MQLKLRKVHSTDAIRALIAAGYSQVMARVYAARGIESPEDLDLQVRQLESFAKLKDIDKGANRLADAIQHGENIAICGDFDADGACGSALLIEGIQDLGGSRPTLHIPNRITQGYGLSPALAAEIPPDTNLVITVDNGISSIAGAKAVRDRGFDLIITDHHLPGETLPKDCAAIINPNQPGCPFPWKGTAGVGVAFYLIAATRAVLRRRGWFQDASNEPPLSPYLDLVALATVADVAPLERNNRIFIAAGLTLIRQGRARPGIMALLSVAGGQQEYVNTETLGFLLGPRINAAGRLEDMSQGVELLLCKEKEKAVEIAQELDKLNRERRNIEDDIREEAEQIAASKLANNVGKDRYTLCPYDPHWHEGVIGIVASRLRERFHRPTIVFTKAHDGSIKGSGRSIPNFHLRDAIARVDSLHPGVITRFGGHAAAAGLSLADEKARATFTQAFEQVARSAIDPADLEEQCLSDGELSPRLICMDTALAIEQGGPWGRGFESPLFHGTFRVQDVQEIRSNTIRCRLKAKGGETYQAIWFRHGESQTLEDGQDATILYALSVNRWNNRETLQIRVEKVLSTTPP